MNTHAEMLALAEPFHPSDVQWLAVAHPKDRETGRQRKDRALVVPFYDVRLVYDRLDRVLGPTRWQIRHTALPAGVYTEIGINIGDNIAPIWIWKGDIGMVSRDDKEAESNTKTKGDASDGAKRAGALWGIGRCYWMVEKSSDYWVDWDEHGRKPMVVPPLPDFALPYDMQKGTHDATASAQAAPAQPAIPEATPAPPEPPQEGRPYPPQEVRKRLDVHYERFKKDPNLGVFTKTTRGMLAGVMEACFPPDVKTAARKSVLMYFFAEESVKELSDAHVAALAKYLDARQVEKKWVVAPYVAVELRQIYQLRLSEGKVA